MIRNVSTFIVIVLMCFGQSLHTTSSALTDPVAEQGNAGNATAEDERDLGFTYPKIELEERLAEILSFDKCKWISGLTCKVRYNGKHPLPRKIMMSAYNEQGTRLEFSVRNQRGKRIHVFKARLIYPKLDAGETGIATFRVGGDSARIVLRGLWDGPYEDPY